MTPRRHPELTLRFTADPEVLLAELPKQGHGIRLSSQARDVLALCDGQRSLEEIVGALGWEGLSQAASTKLVETVLDELVRDGVLTLPVAPEAGASSEESYFKGYAHPLIHRAMISDTARTEGFRRALEALVEPGMVVADVGTGSGILSMFAARAGAKRVHAIERSGLARITEEIVASNGFADVIQIHCADAAVLDLGEPVDLIASEWLGQMAVFEGMFPAVAAIRDRHLRPGGHLVPGQTTLWLAPLDDRGDGVSYWQARPWGFDFEALLEEELRWRVATPQPVRPDSLLAPGQALLSLDCASWDGVAQGAGQLELTVERGGTLSGFCGWFSCELAPGQVLDTGPDSPETHWQQVVFPTRPEAVQTGDRIELSLSLEETPGQPRSPTFVFSGTLHGQQGALPLAGRYQVA